MTRPQRNKFTYKRNPAPHDLLAVDFAPGLDRKDRIAQWRIIQVGMARMAFHGATNLFHGDTNAALMLGNHPYHATLERIKESKKMSRAQCMMGRLVLAANPAVKSLDIVYATLKGRSMHELQIPTGVQAVVDALPDIMGVDFDITRLDEVEEPQFGVTPGVVAGDSERLAMRHTHTWAESQPHIVEMVMADGSVQEDEVRLRLTQRTNYVYNIPDGRKAGTTLGEEIDHILATVHGPMTDDVRKSIISEGLGGANHTYKGQNIKLDDLPVTSVDLTIPVEHPDSRRALAELLQIQTESTGGRQVLMPANTVLPFVRSINDDSSLIRDRESEKILAMQKYFESLDDLPEDFEE